jgi:hypothetical protein
MSDWYRMLDAPDADKAAIRIEKADAARWNSEGYGIFISVNSFNGPRQKACLAKINAWAIDMDEGSKEEQRKKLLSSPLVPSLIVETKRGYQAWWAAKNAKPEHWNAIVLERLVPFFGSDKNARDLCRILRVPGFNHLKDPKEPFLIHTAWKHSVSYTEQQIGFAFAWKPDPKTQRERHNEQRMETRTITSDSLWEAVYSLDCEEALARLSGHWAVGGETYSFKRTSRDHLNIFVDGKSTSCFIDANKRIGSLAGGGPTVAQWLRWFRHDWKTVIAVLKELFPRLAEIDATARKAA